MVWKGGISCDTIPGIRAGAKPSLASGSHDSVEQANFSFSVLSPRHYGYAHRFSEIETLIHFLFSPASTMHFGERSNVSDIAKQLMA